MTKAASKLAVGAAVGAAALREGCRPAGRALDAGETAQGRRAGRTVPEVAAAGGADLKTAVSA